MTVKIAKLRSLLNNKYILAALTVVLSLLLAFIIEEFFINYGQFMTDRVNNDDVTISTDRLVINADGTYSTQGEESGVIIFNFKPAYVYKLRFRIQTQRPTNYEYAVISDKGDVVGDRTIYPEFKSGDLETAVLNTTCDSASIFLLTDSPTTFRLEDFSFDYDFSFNPIQYVTVFILCMVILTALWALLGFIRFSYSWLGAFIILIVGIMLSYLVPYSYTWDEQAHFVRAYYLSEGVVDVHEDDTAVFPYHLEYENDHDYRSVDDYYKYLHEIEELRIIPDTTRSIETTANTYLFLPYVPAGIAIFIGRLFGLNFYYLNILARISNVILYTVLVFFALRLFPSNKKLFFFLALLPNMLLGAVTPGPGAWLSGFMFFTVALIAYIKEREMEVGWLTYAVLMLLFLFITIGRMTYGFFFLLIFLIPRDKFKGKLLKWVYPVITVVLMVASMFYVYNYSSVMGLSTFEMPDVDVDEQMAFVLSNPLRFIRIALSFTFNLFLSDSFGVYPGDLANVGELIFVASTLATIYLLILSLCGNEKRLVFDNAKDRVLIIILCLLSLGATEAAMYISFSRVAGTYLAGFQGRYVYVVFILFLTVLQGKHFEFNFNTKVLNAVNVTFSLFLICQMMALILRYFYM